MPDSDAPTSFEANASPLTAQSSAATALTGLLEQAAHNERILRRYQAFELELLAAASLETVLDTLLECAPQHFKLDAVELCLLDTQKVRDLACFNDERAGLIWLDSPVLLNQLYPEGPVVQLRSVTEGHTLKDILQGRRVQSVALLPLERQGSLIGSLHFGSFSPLRFTSDKSTDFIDHLASIVGVCLENAVNQERLRHLSLIDVLTRVQNRRAFDQAMLLELARSQRSGQTLSLLFADLDHFKSINDDHGHLTGDRVLAAVAREISALLRKTDHVCRYGGEEFALLLPECDRQLALEVAERIRQRVAELSLVSDTGIPVRVSLSIGVTCWPVARVTPPEQQAEWMIAAADRAVYAAKRAGRNRVHYASR